MRTDLAKESRLLTETICGISEQVEYDEQTEILRIDVLTEDAAKQLDKPIGRYVTITSNPQSMMDRTERARLAKTVAKELEKLVGNRRRTLVIGLGNRYIAADALGTKTTEYVFVTRHIHKHMEDILPPNTPSVAAFCANVLGMTGMETVEVVSALTKQISPDLVILIDSLAATNVEHLGCVIQCNNSGIAPGAGVGNFQSILSEKSLGVPVIAIGIPLVISADALNDNRGTAMKELQDLIVTPKDIDAMVKDCSRVLSDAINRMLFGDKYSEIEKLLR